MKMIDDNLIPGEIRTWVGPFADKKLYIDSGRDTLNILIQNGNLKRNSTVLDAGCGCGRITIHLLNYLEEEHIWILRIMFLIPMEHTELKR
jgi:16S rRNA G1207 methylase RsmC